MNQRVHCVRSVSDWTHARTHSRRRIVIAKWPNRLRFAVGRSIACIGNYFQLIEYFCFCQSAIYSAFSLTLTRSRPIHIVLLMVMVEIACTPNWTCMRANLLKNTHKTHAHVHTHSSWDWFYVDKSREMGFMAFLLPLNSGCFECYACAAAHWHWIDICEPCVCCHRVDF